MEITPEERQRKRQKNLARLHDFAEQLKAHVFSNSCAYVSCHECPVDGICQQIVLWLRQKSEG